VEGLGLVGVVRRLAIGARQMADQNAGANPEAQAVLDRALEEYADALEQAADVFRRHGIELAAEPGDGVPS